MRIASTIAALLGSFAVFYGFVLGAFLVGGLSNDGSRLVSYPYMSIPFIGVASAIAVWWWPKAAAALLALAALLWLAFFFLEIIGAPARANDVPGARLNLLSLLVCLVPATVLLLGAFFATRAR
jgi:hypothetical protein